MIITLADEFSEINRIYLVQFLRMLLKAIAHLIEWELLIIFFTLIFPYYESMDQTNISLGTKGIISMAKKILFVDDDDRYRELMSEVMSGEGHRITQANSGKGALQELSKDCDFDVAIVDLHMPGMNGIELTLLIRKQFEMPIILSTGDEQARSLIRGIKNIKAMDKTYDGLNAMLEELSYASGWLNSANLPR